VAASAAGDTYTLRIVFDGLVTLAVKDRSENPQELWALLGNLSDPPKLEFGKTLPPHQSEISITPGPGVRAWGRSTGGAFNLKNEDLSLVANVMDPSMAMVFNTTPNNEPCIAKSADCALQQKDFKWTVDLDLAASALSAQNPADKAFKACLTHEPFDCQDSFPVLAARMKLDKGLVFVKDMQLDDDNKTLLEYKFSPPIPGFTSRALAQRVAVELKIKTGTAVEFKSSPLVGGGSPAKSLFVQADPGQTVEVVISNHRNCPGGNCTTFAEKDFLFNFNLLSKPSIFNEATLPSPVNAKVGGDSGFNGQCSPGSYTAP
jgi:hypothetical protein